MPHDKNGVELKVGDIVTIEFEVKDVYAENNYIGIESVDKKFSGSTTLSLFSVTGDKVIKKAAQEITCPTN